MTGAFYFPTCLHVIQLVYRMCKTILGFSSSACVQGVASLTLVTGDWWNIFIYLVGLCWPVAFSSDCMIISIFVFNYCVNIKGALCIQSQRVCMWNNTRDSPLFTKETILVYMSLFFNLSNLAFYICKTLVNLVTLQQPLSRQHALTLTHTHSECCSE